VSEKESLAEQLKQATDAYTDLEEELRKVTKAYKQGRQEVQALRDSLNDKDR
jgi:chromosome segregation ATPase